MIFNEKNLNSIDKCPGIYAIKNNLNGKIYIGQSKNLRERLKTHYKRNWSKKRKHLYSAFQTHGINNFEFYILYKTDKLDRDELTRLELFYINYFDSVKTGYNMLLQGYYSHEGLTTEELRNRHRENYYKLGILQKYVEECKIPVWLYNIKTKEYLQLESIKAAGRYIYDYGYKFNIGNTDRFLRSQLHFHEFILAKTKEELEIKIQMQKEKYNSFQYKSDCSILLKRLEHLADEYGVLPRLECIANIYNTPFEVFRNKIKYLSDHNIAHYIDTKYISRWRLIKDDVDQDIFTLKGKVVNLEDNSFKIYTREELCKEFNLKMNSVRHDLNDKNIRFNKYQFFPYIEYLELKGLDYIDKRIPDNSNRNINKDKI